MLEQYRRDLEAQLQGQELMQQIERIKVAHPIFREYPTTEDLTALVKPGNRNYCDKDEVLRILLGEMKREATLFPVLNFMFWDSLIRLFRSKCRSVPNPDELFSRIQLDFYRTAVEYPLGGRPRKIDVNLILDTKKKVTRWQRQEALYGEHHKQLGSAHETRPPLADLWRSEVFPEEMEGYLLDVLYRKVINEQQYDLLLETQVYKRMSQKEWAEARGVAYATVRSWRYRAELAIRQYEKARRERADRS